MNYSKWCSRWGFLARVSKDPTRSWRGGLSDTGHIRRTARFAVQRDVAITWRFATSGYAEVRLQWSGLRYTSRVWPWSGTPKSTYSYHTEIWLTSLAPTNEESSWLNEEKNPNRVKNDLSFEWEWCIYVKLVWILTTIKRKSVVESGES